jgi:hypothetical protein
VQIDLADVDEAIAGESFLLAHHLESPPARGDHRALFEDVHRPAVRVGGHDPRPGCRSFAHLQGVELVRQTDPHERAAWALRAVDQRCWWVVLSRDTPEATKRVSRLLEPVVRDVDDCPPPRGGVPDLRLRDPVAGLPEEQRVQQ